MKVMTSSLFGKTAMGSNGQMLGEIDNIVVDSKAGKVKYVLINPAENIDKRIFRIDKKGRLVLPFQDIKAIKDIVVISLE